MDPCVRERERKSEKEREREREREREKECVDEREFLCMCVVCGGHTYTRECVREALRMLCMCVVIWRLAHVWIPVCV